MSELSCKRLSVFSVGALAVGRSANEHFSPWCVPITIAAMLAFPFLVTAAFTRTDSASRKAPSELPVGSFQSAVVVPGIRVATSCR